MSDQFAVSVVVPTYNRAASLDRLLDALDQQRSVPGGFEVIVVDDGSTDDTAKAVARHPRVVYLAQPNAGPAAARNRGWRAAHAPIIAFTDDDTVPSATWLADMADAFKRCPGAAGIGGAILPLESGFLADFVQLERQVDHGLECDGRVRYLVTANCAYRRSTLERFGGFDERFRAPSGEDTDLAMRVSEAGMHLALTSSAMVRHDHRIGLRGLLRTANRHGRTRDSVVASHPTREWGARSRQRFRPGYWAAQFHGYRAAEMTVARSVLYTCLHLGCLAAYAIGIAQSRLVRS